MYSCDTFSPKNVTALSPLKSLSALKGLTNKPPKHHFRQAASCKDPQELRDILPACSFR